MTTTADTDRLYGLIIGADRVEETSAGIHEHIYPANGRVNARVALAGPEDVDRAVTTGREAQAVWYAMTVDERRDALMRLADIVEGEADALVALSTSDNGVPSFIGNVHPPQLVRWTRYYAGWIDKEVGQVTPTSNLHDVNFITHEPYGVVAVILPWNGPLFGISMGVIPALAAGNAVIVKPPELAPITALRFGEMALEAGLPPGLVNVLPADPVGSEALVCHPGVDKIHFTGSAAVARKIHVAAAQNLTPVATELGGKSANIIFDDADVEIAAMITSFSGVFAQSGQSCACGSRILVQDGIYDEIVAKLTGMADYAPAGDPMDPTTVLGPVISQASLDRIQGIVDLATSEGATVLTGGKRLDGPLADGFYFAPTMLAGVTRESRIFRDETFGPVVSIIRFSTEEEAVSLANDTEYGLANYINTSNLTRAHRVAAQLKSGSVFINTYADLIPTAPYGGMRHSGQGRLGGLEGLREFQQVKVTRIGMGAPGMPR